jgi:hypothetical protein
MAKKEEELEMPKNTDTSTDSMDEEAPLPKKPVVVEQDDAEQEIKKAEVAELNKKAAKKRK